VHKSERERETCKYKQLELNFILQYEQEVQVQDMTDVKLQNEQNRVHDGKNSTFNYDVCCYLWTELKYYINAISIYYILLRDDNLLQIHGFLSFSAYSGSFL